MWVDSFRKLWTIWSDLVCIFANDPGDIAGRHRGDVPFYPAVKQWCINMFVCMELFDIGTQMLHCLVRYCDNPLLVAFAVDRHIL